MNIVGGFGHTLIEKACKTNKDLDPVDTLVH